MAEYKTKPQARVLADSVSPDGHRLTTMEVTMHRFVLAEFNTHRVFSRNSASSRAIPGSLQRQRVLETPAMPVRWPSKARGMQGGADIPEDLQSAADAIWDDAARAAVDAAEKLDDLGVHKSVSNRLLEPFNWHTIIVTSTEWSNFFDLRDNELAQPEIAEPARLMREAYDASEPYELGFGQWHVPLIDHKDQALIGSFLTSNENYKRFDGDDVERMVSAARCARVSYLTHEGERDISKDIELYERLTSADPPHASPLEHVATPCMCEQIHGHTHGRFNGVVATPYHYGNFTGWDQLRHFSKV